MPEALCDLEHSDRRTLKDSISQLIRTPAATTMTTLSLKLKVTDREAQDLERLAHLTGQPKEDLLSRAVSRRVRMVRTSYKVEADVEDVRALQEKLRPFREASRFQSEQDFLDDRA